MTGSIVLYLGVLAVYAPGLVLAANRQRILQFPITIFTFLGLFVFNALGSILIFEPDLAERDDYFSYEYVGLLIGQALLYYAVAVPYMALSPLRPLVARPEPVTDRRLVVVLLAASGGIVSLYFATVGPPPLVEILRGGLDWTNIVTHRSDVFYGRDDFWLFNLGFTTLPLVAAIYALALRGTAPRALPSAKLVIIVCTLVCTLPGGKGSVLEACTALIIAYYLLSGWSSTKRSWRWQFSLRTSLVYFSVALVPVLAMYQLYFGAEKDFGELFVPLLYRIVGVYSESIAAATAYVEQHGLLGGITFPTIRGLLAHDRKDIGTEMHHFMFGPGGVCTLSGTAEGYINFGWTGFVALALATFASMIAVEWTLKRAPKNLLTVSLIVFYSSLATRVAQASLFATFVSLTYVATFCLLALGRGWIAAGRPAGWQTLEHQQDARATGRLSLSPASRSPRLPLGRHR